MKLTLDMAAAFQTEETAEILANFAEKSRYERLRRTAREHLAAMESGVPGGARHAA
jgi:hypothetical protein